MVSLLVMDTLNISRYALCSLIEEHQGIQVIANAADITDLIETCGQGAFTPDIFLLHQHSKSISPIIKEVKKVLPDIKVLILISTLPEYNLAQLFMEGIDAIVYEQSDPDLLFIAMRSLSQGQKFLDPSLASFEIVAQVARDSQHALTMRQKEVLGQLAHGYSNYEIADHLCISVETVKSHVHTIRMKLGAVSRFNAARIAWKTGFTDETD